MKEQKPLIVEAEQRNAVPASWLIMNGFSYRLNLDGTDLPTVVATIEDALENGNVAKISVHDESGQALRLYVNGRLIDKCAVGVNLIGKPHEIS